MKLFTQEIDRKLFSQYNLGSDLSKQMVVAKIFNPYGAGRWFLVNSDPQDPDYLWAIVDLFDVEVGSVSRTELESIRIGKHGLPLERDLYFKPINAEELLNGLMQGKYYKKGGLINNQYEGRTAGDIWDNLEKGQRSHFLYDHEEEIEEYRGSEYGQLTGKEIIKAYNSDWKDLDKNIANRFASHVREGQYAKGGSIAQQNKEMLQNQAKEFTHHSKELNSLVGKTKEVDAWVVAKAERATTDLSDITHYLDGRMASGGLLETYKGHAIVETNNVIEVVSPSGSRFIIGLDDSKMSGRRKSIEMTRAEEMKSAREYIDWKLEPQKGSMAKGGKTDLGKYYVIDAKKGEVVSKGFDTEEEAKVEMYKIFEKTKNLFLTQKKISEDEGMMAKGGEIGTTYFIGRPEVDSTGRFGKKRATWKTCVVDENGNKRYGLYTTTIFGSAKNLKLDGVVITQKEFDKLTFSKMEMGGATFKDKVNAISKRLEGTKVPTRLKKDYGATYDKKEAKQAGQRIAGSMIQKLKMKNK